MFLLYKAGRDNDISSHAVIIVFFSTWLFLFFFCSISLTCCWSYHISPQGNRPSSHVLPILVKYKAKIP